jgi:Zn-dependent M16 (insulinase) family peptidase
VGTTTSKLEKALKDSGLGDSVLGDGIEFWLQQWTFHVGMQGIDNQEDVKAVTQVIMDTLDQIVFAGFNNDDVDSAMNTVEFSVSYCIRKWTV